MIVTDSNGNPVQLMRYNVVRGDGVYIHRTSVRRVALSTANTCHAFGQKDVVVLDQSGKEIWPCWPTKLAST